MVMRQLGIDTLAPMLGKGSGPLSQGGVHHPCTRQCLRKSGFDWAMMEGRVRNVPRVSDTINSTAVVATAQ